MSAPTALESGALDRGIAWRVGGPGAGAAGPPGDLPERRSTHPLAQLARLNDDLCLEACDPYEIAAGLEAMGLSDYDARTRYGTASVFEVAEHLWRQVPWRSAAPAPAPDRWQMPWWRAQLRGATYVLPSLVAAVALSRVQGLGGHAVLLLATGGSIAAGQGLSVLGHVLAGRGQGRALAHLGAAALAAAVQLLALLCVAMPLVGAQPLLALAAGGQVLFVVAATVLVVAGSDLVLLRALAPGLLLTAVTGAAGVAGLAARTREAGLLAALLLVVVVPVCAAAVHVVRLWRSGSGEPLRRAVGRPELSVTAVAVGYGAGLALASSSSMLAVQAGRLDAGGGELALLALPLLLTFGTGEHLLHRARRRCVDLAQGARLVSDFSGTAAGELGSALRRQGAAAAVVCLAVATVLALGGRAATTPWAVCFAALSVLLLLTTTLMSLGEFAPAAVLACSAGGGMTLVVLAVPASAGSGTVAAGCLAVVLTVTAVAHAVTVPRFASTAVHR